jgi:hypothetical protein
MKKMFFLLVFVFINNSFSYFNKDNIATSSVQFLKLGIGSRATAMGEASSVIVNDATSLYWNPANLTNINNNSISFMYSSLFADINYQFLGYGHKVGENISCGFGIQYLSMDSIKHTDDNGIETGETSKPYDLAVLFGLGYKLSDWSVGVIEKEISSRILNKINTFAFDFGILSPVFDKFQFAGVVQNVGSKIKFDKESDKLPLNIKGGVAFYLSENFILSSDFCFPIDNTPYFAGGLEYKILSAGNLQMSLRGGYNNKSSIDGFSDFSFGAGISIKDLAIDYSFIPKGDLGNINDFSLNIRF